MSKVPLLNGVYDPNKCHSVLVALLHPSNQLYGYDSNFSKKFNFTLCSKCNSQLTRDQNTYNKSEKNKDPTQENNQILINEKSETTIKQSDKISKVDNTPNSDSSFCFKLLIKTPDLTKPAKAITLEKKPVDYYYEFEELILQRIYDDEESISEENEITPPSKQKKKTSVPKESNLDEIDLMKGEIHKKFKEKHGCNIHKTGYCYIKDDRHLPLTTLHLSMWTNEIYKNHCDYETPPPRPNFGRENSLKVPSSNQSSTASASNKFINCYSHYNIPQPNAYSYYYGWPSYPPPHPQSHPPSHPHSHQSSQQLPSIYIITSIKYFNFTI
ncbi:hypothetical protein GLOIN_2v1791993 [Rhizophagus irregularis DAOM 181602=DAOM 197198]|uniref:Uncharacterized protein n=1 Tax=Rhizophagus irregularis (strain DAOM 181602 / DAOM 197198 / MUCL 43194) TaxID=747089 RepID=A0A2P4NPX8_RHIID|nr:hypothetical protein GLOIN_2v1791993 [Rhizophagus irregularis DAOM 181602=DAOM 197198]POG55184.1 hypothetical protein GLOIN_2v1791993 [Rhizophagus irregularis DAOM 181602=DAOM 197198]|eukprot:XP_025164272.1 hypothetical protein GLOIN_2v1791993 [Rhizophagus irregularis DAOM 181602=DAOM 197198]